MHLTSEQIDACRSSNASDDLHKVSAFGGVVAVVKPPSRSMLKRFRKDAAELDTRLDAFEALCKGCVVAPDAPGLAALFERRPGLIETIGGEILEISGVTNQSKSEKL
jgi:hypothetical protein